MSDLSENSFSANAAVPFVERLIASRATIEGKQPFLTVAIPHYKHRRYLEIVLASLFEQTFDDFEIVVSDDCSPDDSNAVIPALLESSGRPFRYYAQPSNLGYDGNVRFCLASAQGRYVFLLGNDDALNGKQTLEKAMAELHVLGLPEVATTNYEDWASGQQVRHTRTTRLLGSGPSAAIRYFRSFSFVSGILYDREAAMQHETNKWDQSIYYQIYLASRIVAAGGRIAALNLSAVRKDVRVDDHTVPNYASKHASAAWSFEPRDGGMKSVIRVTADAVLPFLPPEQHSAAIRRIVAQIITITYPYWLFEYRRVANWSYAVGMARGLWIKELLSEYRVSLRDRLYLYLLYSAVTFAGLSIPSTLFYRVRPQVADFVRHRSQSRFILEG